MKLKLKKNEIILISILGVVLYALVFYKFIWTPVVPEISKQNDLIANLETQKQSLDNDLANLDSKKIELVSKKVGDERLEGYLNNEANLTDCVDYIDKLAKITESDITDVNISVPEQKEVNKSKYYQIKIDFTANMPIDKIREMIGYIENSSKLMDISRFVLTKPKSDSQETAQKNGSISSDNNFEANLTLNMYTLNLEAADAIYEFSRNKFNRYEYGNLTAFDSISLDTNSIPSTDKKKGSGVKVNRNDFEINLFSFLAAGDNFIVWGSDKSNDKLTFKTNKYISMVMSIGNTSYTISAVDHNGRSYKLNGSIPNRDLNMIINIDIPQINENKDMGLKIQIINNSNNKLNVTSKDKAGKTTLTDRDGKVFYNSNEKEKVYLK